MTIFRLQHQLQWLTKSKIYTRKIPAIWLAILLGLVAFVIITGGEILRPSYVDWLMEGDPGDPATHWLGWQFFRYTPLLQWPIGANPSYGLDIGSSIVFTDSIPLLAFIFKPLSPLLPDIFQYIGLWILICFLLQSIFAWKLLSLFTKNKWLPLIGSVFFTIAPAALWRLYGHYALFGHWVVLAGLYFYFSKDFSILKWIGLLVVTALIHAYLLIIVLVIWSADLCQRFLLREFGFTKGACYFIACFASTVLVMWAEGYFMLGSSVEQTGFGMYRMNLLSLINPDDIWSMLLPGQKGGPGDYEGFNYLGLGMLGLASVAVYALVRNCNKIVCDWKQLGPILTISIGLFLYAISNHIAFGAHELFTYNLPPIAKHFANVFRVSGRFFWPVYYLIYLAIFRVIFSRLKRNVAIIICSTLLLVHCIDSWGALRMFRDKFSKAPVWSSPMLSPDWSNLANRYQKIILVLPRNSPTNWKALAYFAATNRMAINIGYFARVDTAKEHSARKKIAESIINNNLDPDSLYVFENDGLWRLALSQISKSDIAGILDGFPVIAPKLKDH